MVSTLDAIFTGAAGLFLVHSLVKMVSHQEPEESPPDSVPPTFSREDTEIVQTPTLPRRGPPRRIRKDSLCDTLRTNSDVSLFVRPICWTDQHMQLLGVRFNELPPCDTPVPINEPGSPPSRGHMRPSQTILTLSETLTDILSQTIAHPAAVSNSMRTIMSTLWPDVFRRPQFVPELHMYFGHKVYRECVRAQLMWNYSSTSAPPSLTSFRSTATTEVGDSQISPSTPQLSLEPDAHRYTGMPMLCYMGKAQLASIRRNMFRVLMAPGGKLNEPVYNLQQIRSKKVLPSNPDEDAHIAGIMLAMAQKHFYSNPRIMAVFRRGVSPAEDAKPFCDLKLRVMTHDSDTHEFILYTGHITTTFLERFRRPHRKPTMEDPQGDMGLNIDYVRVPVWPILGLRERLGKALGEDLVGTFDPEAMETWEDDEVEEPSSGSKRKRPALSEVFNGSFEESEEDKSSPARNKKQRIRRGTPVQAVA